MDEIDAAARQNDVVSRMQVWMLDFMGGEDSGDVAMAAWPNAAFDMCGLCAAIYSFLCGSFGATIIGKGLMKAPMQAVFFVALSASPLLTRYSDLSFRGAQDALNAAVQALKPGAPEVNFAQIANAKREKMSSVRRCSGTVRCQQLQSRSDGGHSMECFYCMYGGIFHEVNHRAACSRSRANLEKSVNNPPKRGDENSKGERQRLPKSRAAEGGATGRLRRRRHQLKPKRKATPKRSSRAKSTGRNPTVAVRRSARIKRSE